LGAALIAFIGFASSAGWAADTPPAALYTVASLGVKKTTQFAIWKSTIEATDTIGTWGRGLFCLDKSDIYYSKTNEQYYVMQFSKVFSERLAALGYPKYEGNESAFAEKLGDEADFKAGFTLLALKYDACGESKEMYGKGTIKLKVELFSSKTKKVVYSAALNGSHASEKSAKAEAFYAALFGNALDVMFSDPKFVDLFREGGDAASATFNDKIDVVNGSKVADGMSKGSKELLNLVVTVDGSLGSGSGFFIGNGGYILSNYHVVGEAKYVKVKFTGGISTVGEVVRRDPVRDVALIKTNVEPGRSVSVRRGPIKVGEEVYAIGSPFGDQLSGTTTRGIISADRFMENLRYIQSDVSINPGNSGGPLVDSAGDVLAMAVLKKENAAGIGMFIPITEALEKLGLNLK
jgi:S1-C subfamily serine protease